MEMDNSIIANLRQDYSVAALDRKDVAENPFLQFEKWFEEVMKSGLLEPNAMTLATVSKSGQPSARIVLLKAFDERGFVFYTNYHSMKGQEMAENPKVALVFLWLGLQRQVRIEGRVEKVSEEETLAYFRSRPRGSQIGAYASPQSQVIENRTILEDNVSRLNKEYEDTEALPLPDFWGGYRVIPTKIEYWQGRNSRLHDRIVYKVTEDNNWKIERLAP
jgi:pyridoxamine 5'-phosphate oxidase